MSQDKPKRRTQDIPESQRKHPHMRITLDPQAYAILKAMRGQASSYISSLVLRAEKLRVKREWLSAKTAEALERQTSGKS